MKPTEKDLQTAREYVPQNPIAQQRFFPEEWDVIADICAMHTLHLESIGKIKFTEGRDAV